MARRDVIVSNRKWSSGRSGRGTPLHKGGERSVMLQGCNEYGERYEWIEKSNSTSTVRRKIIDSRQCLMEMTEDFKCRLTKRRGCGDFLASTSLRPKSFVSYHVSESGEDADDEESTWSPFSPRPPPIPEADESPPGMEAAVGEVDTVVSATALQTVKTRQNMSLNTESMSKCNYPLLTVQNEVKVRQSQSLVPTQILGRKADKIQSLPIEQIRKSVEEYRTPRAKTIKQVEPAQSRGDVQRVDPYLEARSSSYTLNASSVDSVSSVLSGKRAPHPQDHTQSGIKIKLLTGGDMSRCYACRSHRESRPRLPRPQYAMPDSIRVGSTPLLQLHKTIVYEQGDEPSTTVSFRGHVPPDLLNDIFFGRREYSCPCWPQYDVERYMGCLMHSGHHHHGHARSALSEQRRKSVSRYEPAQSHQFSTSEVPINYASTTRRRGDRTAHRQQPDPETGNSPSRCASQPDQRRRLPLVRFRSEPVTLKARERPHRANSPALRRSSEETSRHTSRRACSRTPPLISSRRDRALRSSSNTLQPADPARSEKQLQDNKRKLIIN